MHPLLAKQLEQLHLPAGQMPQWAAELLRAVDAAYQQADAERRHAEKLSLVASRTDNAVIITDIDGRIEWVNEGFTRISGYTPEEALGKKPGSFLQGPETDVLTIEFMREQLARGEGFKTELLNYARDGRKYWLGIEVQPIYDAGGELRYFMAIESDITDRKRVELELQQAKEQAEQASRSKSEFLANMSHEIRTPLNGVIGMTELLLGTSLTQQQRRYVQIAKSSADALLVVINQILDFSKIEAGKLELEAIDFDLRTVLEEVGEMLAHRAASKGLELAYHVAPNAPTALKGDPSRLRQVLINLVNNAVKFTHKGEVVVRVSVESRDRDQVKLRFAVIDSGVGIPAARLDRLFKAFSQVDASTTRKFGGTGLGLVICKQIAELMGGTIGVESAEGRGSTFWFTSAFVARSGETNAKQSNDLAGIRVLVAEDNSVVRQILCEQLEGWGLRVTEAVDGDEALDRLQKAAAQRQPYQVAILDLVMPGMSALRLMETVRNNSALRATALILLTSLESTLNTRELASAAHCDTLTKPLRQSHLFDAIIRAVKTGPGGSVVPAPEPGSTASALAAAGPARILLAEDNDVNQIVASEILTRAGFRCDVVGNGRQALDATARDEYDLVLMDCQMPEMDGFQATEAIRRREAERSAKGQPVRWLPIVALTANALKGDREQCLAAGMDEYLSKPLDPRHLIATLNRLLAGRKPPPPEVPSPHADRQDSPFDLEALLVRCMGDAEFRTKLLSKFPQQALMNLQQIAQSLASGDAKQVSRAAHGLKGTAANLSAPAVQRLAADIEKLGASGSLENAERLLTQLKMEVERCVTAIQQLSEPAKT